MSEQEILNAVQDIFRDNFDDDTLEITRSTCADDIEDWDSLEQINLLTAIEKKFNIKFKLADVRGLKDVGDLLDLVARMVYKPCLPEGAREYVRRHPAAFFRTTKEPAMNHYTLAEMTPGLTEEFTVTVTPEMMDAFRAITGDVSPIHIDADYARGRGFPGRVVYGMLGASFFSTLAGVYLPGEHCLLHGVECKFAKPIFIGDTLTVKGTVVGVSEIGSEAEIKAVITNQDGKRVTRGIIKAGLAK